MSYRGKDKIYLQLLGVRIRQLRKLKNWSQEEFAFKCGLHRTYVGAVERGERNLSAINLKKLADTLEVGISELFINLLT